MKENDYTTINCPKCGRQYLPAEIFVPDSFFGKPKCISKNDAGQITYFEGRTMDTDETYKCDGCNTVFNISCKVQFNTSVDKKRDFTKFPTIQLFHPKFTLPEGK